MASSTSRRERATRHRLGAPLRRGIFDGPRTGRDPIVRAGPRPR